MAVYKSEFKTISSSREVVFDVLSNLESLAKIQENESLDEHVSVLDVTADTCLLEIKQLGRVKLSIAEKSPVDSIKFVFSELPVDVEAEVNLHPVTEESTVIQFVINAELPKMLKFMLDKKLEKGVETFAEVFEEVLNKHI